MSRRRPAPDSNTPETRLNPEEEYLSDAPEDTYDCTAEDAADISMPDKFTAEVFDHLEFMLRHIHKSRDHAPLMHTLRTHVASAHTLFHMDHYFLQRLGMNHLDAFFFGNFLAICRGIELHSYGDHPRIARLSEAKGYISANFHHLDIERFYLYCVNNHGKLKVRVLLNEGIEDRALLNIYELMRNVLHEKPLGVIVAHNHPQHNLMPSRDDIMCTVTIMQALMAVRVPLLDHLVVTDEAVVSIRENGFIAEQEWLMQAKNNFLLRDWLLPPLERKPRKPKPRTPEEERKRVERELRYARSRRLRKMDKAMRMYRHHSKKAQHCMNVYQHLSSKDERMQNEEMQLRIRQKIENHMERYTMAYQIWQEQEALKKQNRKGKARKNQSKAEMQD